MSSEPIYPQRDEVFYGRAVWPWGEDGDMGVTIEGHGRRALAALNAYQRQLLGHDWRRAEHLYPDISEIWAIVYENCGHTLEEHAGHEVKLRETGYDDCNCAWNRMGLPPCGDVFAWTLDIAEVNLPGALAFTKAEW